MGEREQERTELDRHRQKPGKQQRYPDKFPVSIPFYSLFAWDGGRRYKNLGCANRGTILITPYKCGYMFRLVVSPLLLKQLQEKN